MLGIYIYSRSSNYSRADEGVNGTDAEINGADAAINGRHKT